MATRKVTLSLDAASLALAEAAAANAGLSTSAWLSRAARREAIRTGYAPGELDVTRVVEQAETDEAERARADEEMRAAG